ncbi:MAG: DsrE family protein [Chitinophagaceae bacterium]
MKYTFILLSTLLLTGLSSFGQSTSANFEGAEANLKTYKAIYYLNDSSAKKIKSTLRNIKNTLEDPRLKGKIEIELVAFGDGVEVFKTTNHYDSLLTALQLKGVILAQCLNTMKERKIDKKELWSFIGYVPTGNGEVIIRQCQGWAVMHP